MNINNNYPTNAINNNIHDDDTHHRNHDHQHCKNCMNFLSSLPSFNHHNYGSSKLIPPSIVISGASFDADHDDVGVSTKRFLMLFLFAVFSMCNAFQWIQYAIVTNVITEYYSVSNLTVNWTSVIFMMVYIPGIIPASWILDRKGLRFCVILGSGINCLAAWIKCCSVSPDRFYITMIGQTLAAVAQLFVLNLPPRLAAVWFGPKEVSSATSFGVFGNQIGIALGFILPPLIFNVGNSKNDYYDLASIGYGLNLMFYSVAIFASIHLLMIVFLFEDKPQYPPSVAQALAQQHHQDNMNETSGVAYVIRSLMTNANFVLLFISYGLNVGVFYAISTLLNQLIELRFPDHEIEAGIMGTILVLSGVFGSIACGLVLDQTHKFKLTTLIVYICSLLAMITFSVALRSFVFWPLFIVSSLLGFFMTGYLPIGFEFAAELSYPNPEGTSAGLLNAAAQICGMTFTFATSAILDQYGDIPAGIVLIVALLIGTILTSLVKEDLRRQKAASSSSPLTSTAITNNNPSNRVTAITPGL